MGKIISSLYPAGSIFKQMLKLYLGATSWGEVCNSSLPPRRIPFVYCIFAVDKLVESDHEFFTNRWKYLNSEPFRH